MEQECGQILSSQSRFGLLSDVDISIGTTDEVWEPIDVDYVWVDDS